MYYNNEKEVGFWVTRRTWGNIVARIVAIDTYTSGPLKGLGFYPYFNDAKEKVYAEIFNITRLDGDEMVFEQTVPEFRNAIHDPNLAVISCPNTYSYSQVQPAGDTFNVKWLGSDEVVKVVVKKLQDKVEQPPKNIKLKKYDESIIEKAKLLQGAYGSLNVVYDNEKRMLDISFPYNEDIVSEIKKLNSRNRIYNPKKKSWSIELSQLNNVETLLKQFGNKMI